MSLYLRTETALRDAIQHYTEYSYTLGLDLGQATDPTAIAIIEAMRVPRIGLGRVPDVIPYDTCYRVRHLERLPLGLSYPVIVSQVRVMMATPPLVGNCRLVVDQTGVGRPIVDLFRNEKLRPTGITITAGDGWSSAGSDYRVSKLQLVSQLQAGLHNGILKVAADLPDAAALRDELGNFRANYTESGNMQFGARSGKHDDLVLALACGYWIAKQVGSQRIVQTTYVI